MNTYNFEANGKKIEIEAATVGAAMAEANKQFGSLPQGAWMDTAAPQKYYWAKGNFFD